MSVRSVGATPTKGEGIMAISYTITSQDMVEDGDRCDTLHQCPLCGIAYTIVKKRTNIRNQTGDYLVTDNCDCHDDHTPPMTLGLPTWG